MCKSRRISISTGTVIISKSVKVGLNVQINVFPTLEATDRLWVGQRANNTGLGMYSKDRAIPN